MDDNKRSFGKLIRDTKKSGGERIGHGVEDVRSRVTRSDRGGHIETGQAGADAGADGDIRRTTREGGSGTVRDDGTGNTSETGAGGDVGSGLPVFGEDTGTSRTAPRSPLGPGCARPAGTMFIASISLLFIALRHTRR